MNNTKCSVVCQSHVPWELDSCDSLRVVIAGSIKSTEKIYRLLKEPKEPNLQLLSDFCLEQENCFALIVESDGYVVAAVDRIRSIPIFLGIAGDAKIISNYAPTTLDIVKDKNIDWNSVNQYLLSGYVHGDKTLYKSISSLKAGSLVVVDKETGQHSIHNYYRYLPSPIQDYDRSSLIEEFGQVLDNVIERTISNADGRPIWVPLSGGLDSRLILTKLKQHGYPQLHAFTYGIGGNHEILMARRTAELLGVPWQFIRSEVNNLRQLYHSDERRKYAAFADGLMTVPSYTEFEAFSKLHQSNTISEESIIVNGQSGDYIFGGHVPKSLGIANSIEEVIQSVVDKHCMHWLSQFRSDAGVKMVETVAKDLKEIASLYDKNNKDVFSAIYESWEWSERQPKAVIVNQRLYEFFGYRWELPLWDSEMMEFWQNVPYSEKYNQQLHQSYLRQYNYNGVFDRGRAAQKAFSGYYQWVVWFARVLGLAGGPLWKESYYEYMFFYTYFRAQLELFGREFYLQNYRETRRPRVVAFAARHRLHELGILGMNEQNLPLILL